jgi:hypothetical protein
MTNRVYKLAQYSYRNIIINIIIIIIIIINRILIYTMPKKETKSQSSYI